MTTCDECEADLTPDGECVDCDYRSITRAEAKYYNETYGWRRTTDRPKE